MTVALNEVASAAALLLVSGDYAIAYPNSNILFHGVRRAAYITVEKATGQVRELSAKNRELATEIARSGRSRFLFRLIVMHWGLPTVRAHASQISELQQENPSYRKCLESYLKCTLTDGARLVLEKALDRVNRSAHLMDHVQKLMESAGFKEKSVGQQRAEVFKLLVDLNISDGHSDSRWNFEVDGLAKLTADADLLFHYLESISDFAELSALWEAAFLELQAEPVKEEERTELVRFGWFFFAALCRVLFENENDLTANDALHLGLIDEVIGSPIQSKRHVAELAPLVWLP